MLSSEQTTMSPLSENWGLRRAVGWKLKLCWLPKQCFLTGKPLWGKKAYHGFRVITGPGDPVQEDYWIDKHEFMVWNLRGKK